MDHHDMHRINGVFPILSQLKSVLQQTIVELNTLQHERSNPPKLKRLKTYHTPTQLPNSRVKKVDIRSPGAKHAKRKLQFK
ncbi:hypothetical protein V8B55DRAFT_1471333 [Mucor lusitanicus]